MICRGPSTPLPFWLLRQSLDQAGVPVSLRDLILSFHAHVRFKVANSNVSVLAGRGIPARLPPCAATVGDCLRLHHSYDRRPLILRLLQDVLSECGFEVSIEKSIFILELRGRKAAQAISNVTCKLAYGKHKGVRAGRWLLPLKLSHPYLGVILSFRNFELLSYQHRREKAVQTFARISHVLRDQRAMHVKERIRLGKALVQPVLLYGLAAVGVTPEILKDLTGLVAKQVRNIGRCHSYYTRDTNTQVFDKFGISLPQQCLLREVEQCIQQSDQLTHLQPSRVIEWQQFTRAALQPQETHEASARQSVNLIEVSHIVVETFDWSGMRSRVQ